MSQHPPTTPLDVVLVGLGGALGSLARWGLAEVTPAPWGTFTANVSGSLAIGVLAGWLFVRHPRLRLLLGVGFLGGYTTFSTHLLDAHDLLGEPVSLTAYVGGTLVTCLVAASVGLVAGRRLRRGTS
ncbi:fluoride efflux transporter FluC [Nocardioides sp.]|uniref:fluoride efflux transporter FluC n=1 Tax=Nocardioides sp. TaxID=35761 RepID=UPI002ED4E10E